MPTIVSTAYAYAGNQARSLSTDDDYTIETLADLVVTSVNVYDYDDGVNDEIFQAGHSTLKYRIYFNRTLVPGDTFDWSTGSGGPNTVVLGAGSYSDMYEITTTIPARPLTGQTTFMAWVTAPGQGRTSATDDDYIVMAEGNGTISPSGANDPLLFKFVDEGNVGTFAHFYRPYGDVGPTVATYQVILHVEAHHVGPVKTGSIGKIIRNDAGTSFEAAAVTNVTTFPTTFVSSGEGGPNHVSHYTTHAIAFTVDLEVGERAFLCWADQTSGWNGSVDAYAIGPYNPSVGHTPPFNGIGVVGNPVGRVLSCTVTPVAATPSPRVITMNGFSGTSSNSGYTVTSGTHSGGSVWVPRLGNAYTNINIPFSGAPSGIYGQSALLKLNFNVSMISPTYVSAGGQVQGSYWPELKVLINDFVVAWADGGSNVYTVRSSYDNFTSPYYPQHFPAWPNPVYSGTTVPNTTGSYYYGGLAGLNTGINSNPSTSPGTTPWARFLGVATACGQIAGSGETWAADSKPSYTTSMLFVIYGRGSSVTSLSFSGYPTFSSWSWGESTNQGCNVTVSADLYTPV